MTDPGQRILPGADLGREVPLPPQPPLEDDGCDCRAFAPSGWDQVQLATNPYCRKHGDPDAESPDLPIPAEAREAAAEAIFIHCPAPGPTFRSMCGCGADFPTAVQRQRHAADAVLAAALPHLRSLQVETQVRAGRLLGLEEAASKADELAQGVANPDKPYNEAFIHACGVVARHIRDIGKGDPK